VLQPATALDPHRHGAADHDLVDGLVAQQRLERPETERPLGDPLGELGTSAGVEHRRLAVDERSDAVGKIVLARLGQQPLTQVGGELVEIVAGHGLRRSSNDWRPATRWSPGARGSRRISRANAPAAAR
jgi:hypothetical protein